MWRLGNSATKIRRGKQKGERKREKRNGDETRVLTRTVLTTTTRKAEEQNRLCQSLRNLGGVPGG